MAEMNKSHFAATLSQLEEEHKAAIREAEGKARKDNKVDEERERVERAVEGLRVEMKDLRGELEVGVWSAVLSS